MLIAAIHRLLKRVRVSTRPTLYQTGGYPSLGSRSPMEPHSRILFGIIAYGNRRDKYIACAMQCQAIWPFNTQLSIAHIAVLGLTQINQGLGTKFVEALRTLAKECGFTEILFEEPKATAAHHALFNKIGAVRSEGKDQIGWIWKL